MSTITLYFKNSKQEIITQLRNSGCKLLQIRDNSITPSPIILPGDAIKARTGAVARIVSVHLKNNQYKVIAANSNLCREELYYHFLPNTLGNTNYQLLKSIKTRMILNRN